MNLYYSYFEHPFTNLLLTSSDKGLRHVQFVDECPSIEALQNTFTNDTLCPANHRHDELHQQLNLYLDGVPVHFNTALDLEGTAFQKKVWEAISKISFGQVETYGQIARQLHSPNASRAVGGATGKNPVPIVIPCHRVMGANGKLTGFTAPGGIHLKKRLLQLEGLTY